MGTTTSSRSHAHTYPDSGQDPWYTTFQSYAQSITDDLDNLGTTAISQIVDNATGAVICSFSHVASGAYITFKNASAGSGAEICASSSATNENLKLTPKGSGNLILKGFTWPASDGTANQILKTNGSGTLGFQTLDITWDTAPVLGGNLDVSTYSIVSSSTNNITLASANDVVLKLGDAAGSKKVSIKDSSNAEVASINSDGGATVTSLTTTSATITTLSLTNNLALTKVDIAGATTLTALADDDKILVYDVSAASTKAITKANFNGLKLKAYAHIATPGGTAVINGYNVSSVTDNGTGTYDVNFTTAMLTSTYTVILGVGNSGTTTKFITQFNSTGYSTTKVPVLTYNNSGTATDAGVITLAVFE